MKEQHEAITLHYLHCGGTSSNHVEGVLHEYVGKGTTSGKRAWHSGVLSVPGILRIHLLIPKVYPNPDVICETDHLERSEQMRLSEEPQANYRGPESEESILNICEPIESASKAAECV